MTFSEVKEHRLTKVGCLLIINRKIITFSVIGPLHKFQHFFMVFADQYFPLEYCSAFRLDCISIDLHLNVECQINAV